MTEGYRFTVAAALPFGQSCGAPCVAAVLRRGERADVRSWVLSDGLTVYQALAVAVAKVCGMGRDGVPVVVRTNMKPLVQALAPGGDPELDGVREALTRRGAQVEWIPTVTLDADLMRARELAQAGVR